MKVRNLYLGFLLAAMIASAGAGESMLVVSLLGVKNAAGTLHVGVYADPGSFRKEAKVVKGVLVPAQPGTVKVTFTDLPSGRYAIMAYHDEDANGELNRRFGMFPTEGYGLSNNPHAMGPPAFDDSAFDIVAGKENDISIDMRY